MQLSGGGACLLIPACRLSFISSPSSFLKLLAFSSSFPLCYPEFGFSGYLFLTLSESWVSKGQSTFFFFLVGHLELQRSSTFITIQAAG